MRLSHTKKIRILEFLVIGVVMGIGEDLLAVKLATDATIDWRILWIVIAVAIPFAFISEVVVDNPKFWQKLFPSHDEQEKSR